MAMDMSPSEVRAALVNHFNTNYSETPVEWENIQLPDADKKNPFVSFTITFVRGNSIIKGSGSVTRHSGVIFADVRVPVLTGSKRAYEIADIVCSTLERQRITHLGKSLVTDASELNRTVNSDEYYVVPISIPFRTT